MTFALDDITLSVELAFGNVVFDTNPSWTDITEYVVSGETKRGRSTLLQRFTAGTDRKSVV